MFSILVCAKPHCMPSGITLQCLQSSLCIL